MLIPRLRALMRPGPRLAISLVLLSSLLYSLGYALTKILIVDRHFGAIQLFAMRSMIVLATLLLIALSRPDRIMLMRLIAPPKAWTQRAAGAGVAVSSCLAIIGYGYLPVTSATAFSFTSPLVLTVLGGLVLREQVPARRWFAVLLGFAGMLIIVRPSGSVSDASAGHWIGVGAAIASACLYAVYQIVIRRIRDTSTAMDAIAQAAIAGIVLLGGILPFVWRPVPIQAVLLIVAATAAQTIGLVTINAAVRMGQVSQLAPWQYGGMIWAVLIDLILFDHPPAALAMAGVGLIICGGLISQKASR
ncbi:DMT family transporter [Acidisoma cladoniae]|uniref:DMT family transporter n=1 Tax=Acidisoma cladoniae TaxID=3040935 RepID=UPI002550BE99|nr:DMT family transporter [Acidisoma sp. PAMC 29798]